MGQLDSNFELPNLKLTLECGGTFIIQTSLLKIGCLVHKLGFVATEVAVTVCIYGILDKDEVNTFTIL